ncbi:UNVERIFIED_CONTAM: hypothetical protein K2H54_056683 [Gekko kuhli]
MPRIFQDNCSRCFTPGRDLASKRGLSRPVEEQVEIPDDEEEEDDKEDWGPHLAALEKGQRKIQQNLEEVMLTIPEVVIRVIQAEREAER